MKLAKAYFKNKEIIEIYKGSTLIFPNTNLDELIENDTWSIDKFEIIGYKVQLSKTGSKFRETLGYNSAINIDSVIEYFKKKKGVNFYVGKLIFEQIIDYAECTHESWVDVFNYLKIERISFPKVRELDECMLSTRNIKTIELPICTSIGLLAFEAINLNINIIAPKCEYVDEDFCVWFRKGAQVDWVLKKGSKHGDLHGTVTYVD